MELKDRLKEKRTQANYTQKELAEILNVSRQTISSWEVGRTYPDLDMIIALSDLYNTPLDLLLKEDSALVADITEKVKKSQRRKILNAILLLFVGLLVGIGLSSLIREANNQKVNDYGLSAADLLESTWQLHLDPTKTIGESYLSFGRNDLLILNDYGFVIITPDMNASEINKKAEKAKENGLIDGLTHYEKLEVTTEEDKYIVKSYGYYQEFTKLSDSIIRDANGIEYRFLQKESNHGTINFLANHLTNRE